MEEEPADYCISGGYLRVAVGDKLGPNGRYTVKRKLGWGGFSTVWLAHDVQENKHVAIKICRSDIETTEAALAELHVLKEAMWQNQFHDNIVGLVDSFVVPAVLPEPWVYTEADPEPPVHYCIVVEVLGPNLLTFLEAHQRNVRNNNVDAVPGQAGGLPLPLVKEFSKQLLAATAYLHDYIRHIHTDLKLENIVLVIPDIQNIIERDLLGTPQPNRVLVETTTPEKQEDSQPEVVEIYQSQPLAVPIYCLSSPTNSMDGNSNSLNIPGLSPPSRSATNHLDVTTSSIASTACGSLVSSSTAPSTTGSNPISIATPSSPIVATFANFSRRLSSSFNSLSYLFVRSPPVKGSSPISEMKHEMEDSGVFEDDEEEEAPPPPMRERRPKVLPDLDIKLVDFGNAQRFSNRYSGRIQTRQYRAPEVILGKRDWDKKADMWSIACIIFELVTGDYLFDPPDDAKNRDRAHIYQILELTNPFYDRRWAMSGRQSPRIFNPDGNPMRRLKYRSLQQLLEQQYGLETAEARGLSEFLMPMLAFEPDKRPNAKDLENHPWLAGTKPTRRFPPSYGEPGFDFVPTATGEMD